MRSLGAKAFERFGICAVVMLIYHVFIGLHTYDMAHLHHKAESTEEIMKMRLQEKELKIIFFILKLPNQILCETIIFILNKIRITEQSNIYAELFQT